MATGGYSLCKYTWTGTGSSSWSGTNETLTQEQRLIRVLSNIVQSICENSQWHMDTRFHSSSTDYTPSDVTMQNYTYGTTVPGYNKICFLTNDTLYLAIGITTGGAKLKQSDLIIQADIITNGTNTGYHNAITGLYFSISSSGSWDTTSVDYGVELPQDATKWASFGRTKVYKDSWQTVYYSTPNFVRDNVANTTYKYYFLTKDNQIAIFEKCSDWGTNKIKCILIGELIGAFAHSNDTNALSCISLSENLYNTSTSTSDPGDRGESIQPVSNINNDYYLNQESNYSIRIYNSNSNTQIFRTDGTQPNPYNLSSKTGVGMSVSNEIQLNMTISNPADGGTRWCPLQVYVQSNNPATYGIVENDGFKGYLSTDLIRAVTIGQYSLGSTFGTSKEFYYIGGGLAIGWDETISESLF